MMERKGEMYVMKWEFFLVFIIIISIVLGHTQPC